MSVESPTEFAAGVLDRAVVVDQPARLEFVALYRRWFTPVCRWLRALGGPGTDIDDLAQEVFLIVLRKLPGFAGSDPGPWLWTITHHVARSARRRAWFRHLFLSRSGSPLEEIVCGQLRPDEQAERTERERLLYALLDKMSEKRRTVLVLAEIVGYTAEEIAPLLGVPSATVRTRLFHARKEFMAIGDRHRAEGAR